MTLLRLSEGWPVEPVLAELDAHPELWGERTERTGSPDSPHRESLDIWLRYRPASEIVGPRSYLDEHHSVWWAAADFVPSLRPLAYDLARLMSASELGDGLITLIPPGCQIYPHIDRGWAPAYFNVKLYLILRANEQCWNYSGEDRAVMRPGEVWAFRNDITHGVRNDGESERIAAILTMRVEA